MIETQAEQFRSTMEKLYQDNNNEQISFDDMVCMDDGKNKFIVGRFAKNEDITNQKYTSDYKRSLGGVFVSQLEDGKLTGEPLTILAESRTSYTEVSWHYYDLDKSTIGSATDLIIRFGKQEGKGGLGGHLLFYRREKGFSDVTSPKTWARMIESQAREWISSNLYTERYWPWADEPVKQVFREDRHGYKNITSLFKRFAGDITSFDKMVKEELAREKRVKRFGKLRKEVLAKQEKIAKIQAQKQCALQKKLKDSFFGR